WIGCRCACSNALSRALLITRKSYMSPYSAIGSIFLSLREEKGWNLRARGERSEERQKEQRRSD
ncbi:MAG: hypothetical protein SOW44_06580, partial [Porphyromonas sp.]|nr:hypothetical protein [Porphyromonas sp.]